MQYIAFLRGIGPINPNMHPAKLKAFFEGLGFTNVRTVIVSGNVIFETDLKDFKKLEEKIEKELPLKLGFTSTTIIRSESHLKKLFNSDPFKGVVDSPSSRLNVTFLKKDGEVFSVIDTTTTGTPDIMRKLEKEHGKEITTRTWKTVGRIVKKFSD